MKTLSLEKSRNSDNGKRSHESVVSEINVVPLVDVILVLLIIFMITAPLMEQGLDVDLPVADAPAIERSETDVILTINAKGQFFLMDDPNPYGIVDLEKKLAVAYQHRDKKEIFLKASKQVRYGLVARALAILKKVGIERVGMVTQPPGTEETS